MAVSAPNDRRFRRAHVSPARKRSWRAFSRRGAAIAMVTAAVAVFAAYRAVDLVMSAEALTVTRITVSGNTRLTYGEVEALLDGLSGRNMLLVSLDEWRQRVLTSPWVEDAALRRVLPGTVNVVIVEREPMGIGRIAGGLYLLDQHGGIIDDYGPHHANYDLPIIDGLAPARRPVPSGVEGSAGDQPLVDEGRAALASRVISSLQSRPELAGRVSQIDVSDPRDAVVILKNDTALVRIGDDQFAERLQSYLDLVAALREKVPQIDYVDLRFGERVYVRPQRRSGGG
jgi:cell division protein FtsQ